MKKVWVAVLLFLAGCQTERSAPGATVVLSDAQVALVQEAVRGRMQNESAPIRFSLLRAADAGSGRVFICGVFGRESRLGEFERPLPFRAVLDPAGSAAVLDLGGSRYRNEVIAARCGRSGISTQNMIVLR